MEEMTRFLHNILKVIGLKRKKKRQTFYAGAVRFLKGCRIYDLSGQDWFCDYKVREGKVKERILNKVRGDGWSIRTVEVRAISRTAVITVHNKQQVGFGWKRTTRRIRLFKDFKSKPNTIHLDFSPPSSDMFIVTQ